ncbi:MAG: thiol reductant ABC exporter subunit CydC [Chloroflexi bacterium]|nr:thiol reductant ABC exporter subunit CydC [Chloroflexota bacterium]
MRPGPLARPPLPLWSREDALPAVAAVLLNLITVASNVALLAVAGYLIAAAALHPPLAALALPIYAVRVAGLVRATSRYTSRLTAHRFVLHRITALRVWLFETLIPLTPARLMHLRHGDLLTGVLADSGELENGYLRVLLPLVTAAIGSALSLLLGWSLAPGLTVVLFLGLILPAFLTPAILLRLQRRAAQRELEARSRVNTETLQLLQVLPDVLLSKRREAFFEHIGRSIDSLATAQRTLDISSSLAVAVHELAGVLSVVAGVAVLAPSVTAGSLSGPTLVGVTLSIVGLTELWLPVPEAVKQFGRVSAAAQRLSGIASLQPAITNAATPSAVPTLSSLRLEHVSFRYSGDAQWALRDVSTVLPIGEWIAIVGANGSGKSTLGRLLARYWDPEEGQLTWSGIPLPDLDLSQLRQSVAYVEQEPHLFETTLRENLLVAAPQAHTEELLEVLAAAQLLTFVQRLPQGLDSWIGEQGILLSGGERQRLAVARVLLRNAPLIMLDEVTAHLDPVTAAQLIATLRLSLAGRTVIVMTHDTRVARMCDTALVFDRGYLQESGHPEQLERLGGPFARLCALQRDLFLLATS